MKRLFSGRSLYLFIVTLLIKPALIIEQRFERE
jgi:hypothetical protein